MFSALPASVAGTRELSADGLPARREDTLMSSSRSGQWIPSPRAIRVLLARSAAEPCRSRGNHANGTEMQRPSDSSTLKVSSDAATAVATGIVSLAEVVIPGL